MPFSFLQVVNLLVLFIVSVALTSFFIYFFLFFLLVGFHYVTILRFLDVSPLQVISAPSYFLILIVLFLLQDRPILFFRVFLLFLGLPSSSSFFLALLTVFFFLVEPKESSPSFFFSFILVVFSLFVSQPFQISSFHLKELL